jgi:predicted dehydrogenase/threonine dehydrogenase-like Zn-dependent dehydrogenase
MKQILQNISNGETSLVDIPTPLIKSTGVLIATSNSLISPGTERMLIDFGKASYLEKIKQQPDKVKTVFDKIKTDGLVPTIDAVKTKLDQPIELGYCNSGYVIETNAEQFSIGDRVASNGCHAEIVSVGRNLCAKIPDEVDDESASFTVMGAIALEGIRLINPSLGDSVVVSGLGLVGLLTVQLLKANGCRVVGIDFNSERCDLAESFGAETINLSKIENPLQIVKAFTRNRGADAVIIATATKSDDVIHQAASMCRQRGQIILVGTSGLNIRREDFYEKEITFKVSCSYGPGRYDPVYEEDGIDYPVGFVRWTEQRNFEAVLDMMADGKLDLKQLITDKYDIDNASQAYKKLDDPSAIGILLKYPNYDYKNNQSSKINFIENGEKSFSKCIPTLGFLGAGNYASRVLIPEFKSSHAELDTLVSSGGVSGSHHGKKAGFKSTSTEINDLLMNDRIDTLVIATRHNLHAKQVISALKAGKNVFVEKPLALTLEEIDEIERTYIEVNDTKKKKLQLMVGFNRRFSPHIIKMKSLLESSDALTKSIIYTVNAGELPDGHWLNDPKIGGGRVIGEACHFIDLMSFLLDSSIVDFHCIRGDVIANKINDQITINLKFKNGSFGTIHYLTTGGQLFPKERVEVFCNNSVLQIDNYRSLTGFNWPGFNKYKTFSQDKGQKNCIRLFTQALKEAHEVPIPFNQIIHTSRISIEIANSLFK